MENNVIRALDELANHQYDRGVSFNSDDCLCPAHNQQTVELFCFFESHIKKRKQKELAAKRIYVDHPHVGIIDNQTSLHRAASCRVLPSQLDNLDINELDVFKNTVRRIARIYFRNRPSAHLDT